MLWRVVGLRLEFKGAMSLVVVRQRSENVVLLGLSSAGFPYRLQITGSDRQVW